MAGVGEDDVRAVPQQQSVGELLVDDADIAGDDDGSGGQAQGGESVQHRLDGAADEGEDDDVVPLVPHAVQELDGRDLAHPAGVDADVADLGELARGRGGPAAQQQSADLDVLRRGPGRTGGEAARGERAPFPPGVGVGEYGYPEGGRLFGTWGHVPELRKAFRFAAQRDGNSWLTARRRLANRLHKGDAIARESARFIIPTFAVHPTSLLGPRQMTGSRLA